MIPIETHAQAYRLPTRNGRIVDGRIGWWQVQSCGQAIVLTVSGELDASNAALFEHSLQRVASVGDPFVVDTTPVGFIGVRSIGSLLEVDEKCRDEAIPWSLVATTEVRATLRIVDHYGTLPLVDSLSDALHELSKARPGVVRLVPRAKRPR